MQDDVSDYLKHIGLLDGIDFEDFGLAERYNPMDRHLDGYFVMQLSEAYDAILLDLSVK